MVLSPKIIIVITTILICLRESGPHNYHEYLTCTLLIITILMIIINIYFFTIIMNTIPKTFKISTCIFRPYYIVFIIMMTIPIIIIINIFTISVSQITSARRPYRTTISILPVLIQSSKNLVKTVDQCIRRIRATE